MIVFRIAPAVLALAMIFFGARIMNGLEKRSPHGRRKLMFDLSSVFACSQSKP